MVEKKFDKNKYDQKFHKENYRRFTILFRNSIDAEIIEKIESTSNTTDYIRGLVRADIEREKQANTNPKQK